MPNSKLGNFHLIFLEDFLPLGMAIVERAKVGGVSKVLEGFTSSENPLEQLKVEGASSAHSFREKLDRISPGLGNPAVEIEVSEMPEQETNIDKLDETPLITILNRIDDKIEAIQNHFD